MNIRFLEAYKRLDKLCREIYDSEKGVTSYIQDMQSKPLSQTLKINNWNSDLKKLIALRHLRNQFGHDVGAFDNISCRQSDIDWLVDFKERIINGTDPISLLRKQNNKTKNHIQKNEPNLSTYLPLNNSSELIPENKQKTYIGAIRNILIAIIILASAFVIAATGYAITG